MGNQRSIPPTRREGELAPETVRSSPPGVPAPGDVIANRYRVERLIGVGGMAHVVAARHLELGHVVAIKVIDPSLVDDVDAKERFAREARMMATLTSRYSVRVHDVGVLDNALPFMVMDYLDGTDLSRVLAQRGPLPFDEACSYIDQACEAVAEAHHAGLVHRDLKPQNLFVTKDKSSDQSTVRVLDFGIARAIGGRVGKFETITKVGDVVGTLTYMAPEQIRDSTKVDERTDIWALGACLYRLVANRPPFSAPRGQDGALIEQILTQAPRAVTEHRADTPKMLVSVIMRCLRKSPEERFQKIEDLRSALAEVQGHLADADATAKKTGARREDVVRLPSSPGLPPPTVPERRPQQAPMQQAPMPQAPSALRPPTPFQSTTPLDLVRPKAVQQSHPHSHQQPSVISQSRLRDEVDPRIVPKPMSTIWFVVIVLAVASLVVAGGAFVLLSSAN